MQEGCDLWLITDVNNMRVPKNDAVGRDWLAAGESISSLPLVYVRSGQDVVDDVPLNIREPEVSTAMPIGKLGVVEAA
jgi:hypothetical protein